MESVYLETTFVTLFALLPSDEWKDLERQAPDVVARFFSRS